MADFSAALEIVLRFEGGYVYDPADPGGETNYGVSKRAHPTLDIANLTREQAATIYRTDYWNPCGCDGLEQRSAVALFDTAVNLGVTQALSLWRGDVDALLWLRLAHYSALVRHAPPLEKFLAGWLRRVLVLQGAA